MRKSILKTAAFTLTASLLLAGCGGINKEATLVNIDKGKDKITLGYGNFVARYTQSTYDTMYRGYFGDDYWDKDMYGDGKKMQTTVKKEVMDSMEENYLAKQHASEYKVEISKDQTKDIEKAAKKFMKSNEEDAIEQMGATEDYAKTMMEYETYGTLVKDKVREETKVKTDKKDYESSTISYVQFSMTGDDQNSEAASTESDTADDQAKAQAKAKADAVVVGGAKKFKQSVETQQGTVSTASYVTAGDSSDEDLDKKVIDAAKKLKEGQMSKVIEVEDEAYFVVKKDKQNDKEASESKKKELEEEQRDDHYDDTLKAWKKKISWEVDKSQWKKVKFDSLFSAPKTDEDETEETGASSEEGLTTDVTAE